jgi:hypothetical protein
MSYTTIAKAFVDASLIGRVRAAVAREAFGNATLGDTVTGRAIIANGPDMVLQKFLWPVAIATEADYAYAVGNSNPDPGGDEGVVTDAAIASAVQANWPEDESLPPRKIFLQVVEAGVVP